LSPRTDRQRNFRDRSICEKNFRTLDPPIHVKAMRRHSQSLPEGPRKMVRAQLRDCRQRGETDRFRKMLFDEFKHSLALPTGKATVRGHPWNPNAVKAH